MLESDVDGITNIFTYSPARHILTKVTNARYGAFNAHFDTDSGTLYYSDYDERGYLPVTAARGDLLWEDASFDNPYIFAEAERFTAQSDSAAPALSPEAAAALRFKVDSLPVRNYFKPFNWFNIHSWAPLYAGVHRIMNMSYDHIYQLVAPGVTLISQNKLGTAVSIMGYSYHDHRHAGHFNFQYSGLWPMFEFSVDFNDRAKRLLDYSAGVPGDEVVITETKDPSVEVMGAVYTKINLSRGGWQSGIIPRIEFKSSTDEYLHGCRAHLGGDAIAGVRYYSMLPKVRQNRMPRLGIGAEVKGAYQMGAFNGVGKALYGYTYGYLPGFTLEQGWKLTASVQKRFDDMTTADVMKNLAKLPRGYRDVPLNDYFKVTADYSIPIAVNDWHPVPILLYLMRVNVVPFVDYAQNRTPAGDVQNMMSYGSVLTLQCHVFRIGFEVELGGRFSRYLDLDGRWKTRAEFVTSLGL